MAAKAVRIGMIGCGVVGGGVAKLLIERKTSLAARVGAPLELVKVAVRDASKKRDAPIDRALFTDNPYEVAESGDIDIVLEVMGGQDPALDLTLKAAKNGKSVVTANKHLLALHGQKVYETVEAAGVELGFEAAVAGAIPIIRTLKGAFAANTVESIHGIVNGTGNYILSRMADEGEPFDAVLKDAQRLGYAEADPTFDVEGIDSAHKIAILASLGFETPIDFPDVYTEGITSITPEDIDMAREFGYRIKLMAIAKRAGERIDVRVHPAMVRSGEPIANVNGALNAVEVVGDSAGVNMLVGPGAGQGPTASAVMGDVVDIARRIIHGGEGKMPPMGIPVSSMRKIEVRPIDDIRSKYYLRFTVPDRPGVLAALSGALGENDISIASMIQRGRREDKPVSVVLMTHTSVEANLKKALARIDDLGVCAAPTVTIRIEGDGEE